MKRFTHMTMFAAWAALAAFALTTNLGCSGGGEGPAPSATADGGNGQGGDPQPTITTPVDGGGDSPAIVAQVKNPVVTFKTSAGEVKVELNAEKAPITVDNFLANYVERGYYNGTIFHYVDQGNIIVGGGYDADGNQKSPRAEIQSEADNGLKNLKGTISMARSPDWQHSATSQFFFNLKDNPSFDHQNADSADTYGYCVFGKVISGMDVLQQLSATPVHESDISPKSPVQTAVLDTVTVIK